VLSARVEAGSNTSIVVLRAVGGDEEESQGSEAVKYGHMFPWDSAPKRIVPATANNFK
jgi:hypothetical protein